MIINFGKGNGGGGSTGGGIPEAPKDGKLYGRKDATWSEVPEGAIGIWIPKYRIQPNAETGRDELIIDIPLTDEQKAENLKNLPLLADENTIGYFKVYEFRDNGGGLTQTRYFTYPIINKYILKSSDGYETWKFKYLYESLKEDTVRMDISTGDVQRIYRYTYQDKLVSGENIKTINGQDILGSGNLEFSGGGGMVEKSFTLYSPSIEKDPTQPNQFRVVEGSVLTPEQKQNNIDALKEINTLCNEQTYQPDISIYLNWRYYKVIMNYLSYGFYIIYDNYKLEYDFDSDTGDVRYIGINLEITSGGGGNDEEYKLFIPVFKENEYGELIINSDFPLTQEQIDSNNTVLQKIKDDGANLTKDEQALLMEKVVLIQPSGTLFTNMLTPIFSAYPNRFEAISNSWRIYLNFRPDGNILWNQFNGIKLKNDVNEAPKDGQQYARQNGNWTVVTSGGGSASAPTIGEDGNWYIDGVDTGKPSRGPQGDMGNQGEAGKDGTVVTAGEDGFWYLDGIKSDKPWKGEKGDRGEQGPQGDMGNQGKDGMDGMDGKSAYQVAVDNGFAGTEQEWLDSLKGEKGDMGNQGEQGMDGKSAYQVAVENGFLGNEQEWLDSLKGEKGDMGETPELKTINGETIVGSGDITVAGGIEDAPSDGNTYSRKDGNWTIVDKPIKTITVPDYNPDGKAKEALTAEEKEANMQVGPYFNAIKVKGIEGTFEILDTMDSGTPIDITYVAPINDIMCVIKVTLILYDGNVFFRSCGQVGSTPELKTINGESLIGSGDIAVLTSIPDTYATTAYVDNLVGTANNRLNLI